MRFISVLFVFVLFTISSCGIFQGSGGQDFQGKITFQITYEGADLEPAQKAQLPTEATMYVMGNYSKMVVQQGMAEITQITDGNRKTVTSMISAQGIKKYYTQSEEEILAQEDDQNLVSVEEKEETKEIAGFTARKIVATFKNQYGEEETLTMFYTPEIGNKDLNFDNPYMRDIDGLVLEYEMKQGDFIVVYSAKEVEEKRLRETDFLIPDDFERLTEEERQQMGM